MECFSWLIDFNARYYLLAYMSSIWGNLFSIRPPDQRQALAQRVERSPTFRELLLGQNVRPNIPEAAPDRLKRFRVGPRPDNDKALAHVEQVNAYF